jgi:hypothetical protein
MNSLLFQNIIGLGMNLILDLPQTWCITLLIVWYDNLINRPGFPTIWRNWSGCRNAFTLTNR